MLEVVRIITISKTEFSELKLLQKKPRRDWDAEFGSNWYEEIWPSPTQGLTPLQMREQVRGRIPVLDDIADEYSKVRVGLGRMFIDRRGAFFKRNRKEVQFVCFEFSD